MTVRPHKPFAPKGNLIHADSLFYTNDFPLKTENHLHKNDQTIFIPFYEKNALWGVFFISFASLHQFSKPVPAEKIAENDRPSIDHP